MKTYNFPYVAFFLGLILMPVVIIGSRIASDGFTSLPLLTLLIVSEFAAIVTAIGAYTGLKNTFKDGFKAIYATISIACLLLSARFLYLGIGLWPGQI